MEYDYRWLSVILHCHHGVSFVKTDIGWYGKIGVCIVCGPYPTEHAAIVRACEIRGVDTKEHNPCQLSRIKG